MKKLISKIINQEFWLNEDSDDTTPRDGLPVFNRAEIELMKTYKHILTKEFMQNVFTIKRKLGTTLTAFHFNEINVRTPNFYEKKERFPRREKPSQEAITSFFDFMNKKK